ncbi:hypothetical protein [uncultured Porphyromonas sp.]|uniref:hypothetical protein n=1 Tax=uncultured Porphyromonas sp. TaxID=159274 RepID=UPI00259B8794|nr:hypothetical protein [uncultured Porphyromonas sp.]
MATFLETSKKFIEEEDVKMRERLVMKLDSISVHQLPALEEWIKTGNKEAVASLYRGATLRDLYEFKGNDAVPLNKEARFVGEFIRLMYIYFPDEPMWKDEELKNLIPNSEDTVVDE